MGSVLTKSGRASRAGDLPHREHPEQPIDPNFAVIAAGVAVVIVYGSLFPFHFQNNPGPAGPLRTLVDIWHIPPHRGDFLANVLLYIPYGLFLVPLLRRWSALLRIPLVTFGGLALSVILELAQFYVPGRVSSLADVYANTLGSLLGAVVGTQLFRRPPKLQITTPDRPFVMLLLLCWLGYRLVPFVPTIDLHKFWTAIQPLILTPSLPPLDLCRHITAWLAVALLLEALVGTVRSRHALLLLVSAVLFSRILIDDAVLSPAEVIGAALASVAWSAVLWRLRMRAGVVTALFVLMVVIKALEPFRFSHVTHQFQWIPFRGFMSGSPEESIRSFLYKAFTYGALIWLLTRVGCKLVIAASVCSGLVLRLRLVQVFLPGRSAEITDVILVVMLAGVMKLMGEDPAHCPTKDHNLVWWRLGLMRLYEILTRDDAVQPADLIFVLAGRMERKRYGLELYRAGLAPRLVFSVGRFEVSRMHQLELPGIDQLIALRDATPPEERNFFVDVDSSGVRIEKATLRRCSTYGEGLAIRRFWEQERAQRVIVISTDVHLYRVAVTFAKIFRHLPPQFLYCPVPVSFGFLEKDGWWTRPDERRFVVKELMKLVGYRLTLSTPAWATQRLMRLKD